MATADFVHPGPRRFLGWKIDTSLFATASETFEVHLPSSDFSALRCSPGNTADMDA